MPSLWNSKGGARLARWMSSNRWVARGTALLRLLGRVAPIYWVLLALLVWIAYINPSFLRPRTFLSFMQRATPLMLLSAGQLFVVASGGFDLSVGSLITLVVLAAALLLNGDATHTWSVIALLFAMGIGVGIFNGSVTSYLRVPSLITTLGMLLTLKGAALYWSGGSARGYLPDNFRQFGRVTLRDIPLIGDIPYAVLILLVAGCVAVALFHRTNFGRQVLAVGDNPRAAALSGIHVPRVRIGAFCLSSASAVLAGILLGGFSGVSTYVGQGYELQAVSAVVLGGGRLLGGRGSMPAAMAGGLALSALFTLLNLLGLPKPLRDAVQGTIIVGAAAYGTLREGRR